MIDNNRNTFLAAEIARDNADGYAIMILTMKMIVYDTKKYIMNVIIMIMTTAIIDPHINDL